MTDGLRRKKTSISNPIVHSKLMIVVSLSHGKVKERYLNFYFFSNMSEHKLAVKQKVQRVVKNQLTLAVLLRLSYR